MGGLTKEDIISAAIDHLMGVYGFTKEHANNIVNDAIKEGTFNYTKIAKHLFPTEKWGEEENYEQVYVLG